MTVIVEVIRSFLQVLRGCWKHNFLKKKANFPVRKSFWPVFYRMFEFDKPQGTVYISPEASLTITDEKLRSFLHDLRGCWKHNFLKKKVVFPVKKRFWPTFSHFIENKKVQETIVEGPQGLFDNYLAIDKNFSLGPRRSIARFFFKNYPFSLWQKFLAKLSSCYQLWQFSGNSF